MLRSYMLIGGMAALALGVTATVNCGSSAEGPGGGGSTSTSSSSSSGSSGTSSGAQPPPAGPTKPADGTASVTFAISKLYLGDTDWAGVTSPDAWKKFGYDLDGKISTATSTDLCKPSNNAAASHVYPDGDNGIDNAFGKDILTLITTIAPTASTSINDSLAGGSFTIMLDMEKLGTATDYNPITTQLYAGGNLGGAPKWDGTDVWPVRPELLNDPTDITKGSKVKFASSYLTGNTWVSGSKGTVTLSLSIQGYSLDLAITNAWITAELDTAHKKATKGIIAGVLDTQKLIDEISKIAGGFDVQFCDPNNTLFQSIATQLKQASDMIASGPQDPTKTCDGISIGLGFDADVVKIGAIAPASTGGGNPCADAGAP